MNWKGESCLMMGTLGAAFYFVLGVCSLPSVIEGMTSVQFQIVFGLLAWVALIFGSVHVMIMGVQGWSEQETWPKGMPPITILSVVVPLFIMSIKLFQVSLAVVQTVGHKLKKRNQSVHPTLPPDDSV